MSFVLIFDIPRNNKILATRVLRSLKRINARLIQFSTWKSENLAKLIEIARMVKANGGSARILEEKFIF